MAIKTVPSATPLGVREPVLIVYAVVTVVAVLAITLVAEKLDYFMWLAGLHAGLVLGLCFAAIMLTGLMGRSWLGAYGIVLGAVTFCFSAVSWPDWWRSGFGYRDFSDTCLAPLVLLIAATPSIVLRQLGGLRLASASDVPWSRRTLSIGDIFIAVAFTAALLVFASVSVLGSYGDRAEFWAGTGLASLLGFGFGMLIVVPAVWCFFAIESRWNMVFGLGVLVLLPSVICAAILPFISAETLSDDEKVEGFVTLALASVAAAAYFFTLLLLLHVRGYRLLRAPLAAPDAPPARYRHASRWIVAAIVAAAAVVNVYISPLAESRQWGLQFDQWLLSLGGHVITREDGNCMLDLGHCRVTDDDLKYLRNVPPVFCLVLSGTDITDAGLEFVGELTLLQRLVLDDTAVTDRGMEHVLRLPNLQSLSLQNTGVTGGAFAEFESRGTIVNLDLNGAAVTDEGCRGIGTLTALQELNLNDTSITDAGLSHLGGLTSLQRLDLARTVFTGSGFEQFDEMPDLAAVDLTGSRCGDGVAHLVSRAPWLHELRLGRTAVTDAVMLSLQGHESIAELELTGTAITDDGVRTLGKVPNLHKLWLNETSVTGAGLRDLQARSLEELHLEASPVSDESLAHLKRFPRLHDVLLNDTPIGDLGLAHFAGRCFVEMQIARTQVTAQGLLRAHFDAGQLTIDDQQATDAELASLEEMYISVIVVPKKDEADSE